MGVVYVIKNNYSSVDAVRQRLLSLHLLLSSLNSSIVATHIAGECNIASDNISRLNAGDAYQLDLSLFR
ncbi:MAG: hypothetical protein RL377_1307 [Bacteroidota bacterium]|jgi:hypothetical protein